MSSRTCWICTAWRSTLSVGVPLFHAFDRSLVVAACRLTGMPSSLAAAHKRIETGVVVGVVLAGEHRHHDPDQSEVVAPLQLGHGPVHVLVVEHADAPEPIGVGGAELLGQPGVVGPKQRPLEVDVGDRVHLHGDGRKEDLAVDAVAGQVGEAGLGVVATPEHVGLPTALVPDVLVAPGAAGEQADRRQLGLVADQPIGVGVVDQPGRPVAVVGVHVALPEVVRLDDMGVGRDDVVGDLVSRRRTAGPGEADGGQAHRQLLCANSSAGWRHSTTRPRSTRSSTASSV